jgi:thioredoxin 1
MKIIRILFLVFASTFFAYRIPLRASSETENKDLEIIFRNSSLNAPDYSELLYPYAAKVLSKTKSEISPHELIKKFKELALTPDVEKRFLTIYTSYFNEKELKEVSELMQNQLYLKYRRALDEVNFKCLEEMMASMKEIALTTTPTPPSSSTPTYDIIQLNKENYKTVINSSKPVVIDVYADWCGPCKLFAPIFKELNSEYGNLYQFAKLNGDDEDSIREELQVTAFPTILFIKNGKVVGKHEGFMNKEKFQQYTQNYFK